MLRADLFKREPLCRMCAAEGRVTLATIRDHIIPLAEGGRDVPENVQPICAEHHTVKSQDEANRGKRRG